MRPYRKEKVASVVRHVIGEAILRRLADPRVSPLTTVTRVEMSPDLLIARVYLSVAGDRAQESRTLRAVRHAGGYLQRQLASELPLRQCPELRFDMDEVAKSARRTMELIAKNREEDPQCNDLPPITSPEADRQADDDREAASADPVDGKPPDRSQDTGV